MEKINFDYIKEIHKFKENLFESKKYWLLYLVLMLIASISIFKPANYAHPNFEITIIFIFAILGVFCITFFNYHREDNQLYKTAFVIILLFGIMCAFLMPICYSPDEVEHFVRAEITSRGVIMPEYVNGSFLTIQSVFDLIEEGKGTGETGFTPMNLKNSSIFNTNADTQPINSSLVKYPSAFAQNPFFGYLMPAIGIFFAKLFNLNAIWLVWLGRLFNVILYASLVSYAIRKTPIAKVPMIVMACIPLAIFQSSSLSIDALICGLGMVVVAYFFYMYKSPKESLTKKEVAIFSALVLLLGLSKVTYFAFILLLFLVPKRNFNFKKYYLYSFLILILFCIIAILWTKFYADPGFMHSFRKNHLIVAHASTNEQIAYLLSHKKETLITLLRIPAKYLHYDMTIFKKTLWFGKPIGTLYLMFLGAVCLLYPKPDEDKKTRLGALIISTIVYYGTYITMLLSWTRIGQLHHIVGVQTRYFLPLCGLLPFILGFNNMQGDKSKIDSYIIVLTITFVALVLIAMSCAVY